MSYISHDNAYIAGFMDGEGSIQIRKQKDKNKSFETIYPQIQIGNTNKPIMQHIQNRYGGKIQIHRKGLRTKEFYHMRFKSQKAIKILKDIIPYLKIKKQQAKICLKIFKTYNKNRKRRKDGTFRKLDKRTYLKRLQMFNLLKQLNKKGTKKIKDYEPKERNLKCI